jgi:ubiquinone/menaquinone biosynthesis C-methylase UbiE
MPGKPDRKRSIPALGFHALTALYDPAVAILLREGVWKSAFMEQVGPRPGERILDLGCGTGTLAILLKKTAPEAEVVGVDADQAVLDHARRKADDAGLSIQFQQAFADEIGEPATLFGTFDKIVSSLLFHHLDTETKRQALAGAWARLRPGGELHIADWGRPQNLAMRALFVPVQLLDGFATTRDNVLGRLPELVQEAGFAEVAETRRWATALGSLSFYRARKAS